MHFGFLADYTSSIWHMKAGLVFILSFIKAISAQIQNFEKHGITSWTNI